MVTATLAGSAQHLGVAPLTPALALPAPAEWRLALGLLAAASAAFAAIGAAARAHAPAAATPAAAASASAALAPAPSLAPSQPRAAAALELAAEGAAGFTFALGLGLSGMTSPAKVCAAVRPPAAGARALPSCARHGRPRVWCRPPVRPRLRRWRRSSRRCRPAGTARWSS
jgi:hypothetical protein